MLMFVSFLKCEVTQSSTSSVVAGIGTGIDGSAGEVAASVNPEELLGCPWAGGQQVEEANLAWGLQLHSLLPFLLPCNRIQARTLPYSWALLSPWKAPPQSNSVMELEGAVVGVCPELGSPPNHGPR